MDTGYYSRPTRLLHYGLAVTITFQLAISLVMAARAHHGVPPGAFAHGAFEAHRFVGLASVAIVVLHWLWSARPHMDGGIGHLFPWAGANRARLFRELGGLLRGQLPEGGPHGGLAGAVHGLGLLVATAMAASGVVLFFLFPESGPLPGAARAAATVHSAVANLVWAYWGGHVGMAVVHHLTGHDTLRRMFRLGAD